MKRFAVAASLLLAGCGGSSPTPEPRPIPPLANAWQFQFSPGMTSSPDGSFSFPVWDDASCNNCPSIHYMVKASGPLTGQMSASLRIETTGDPTFNFKLNPNNTCGGDANVSLYIQRRGDDWSGAGSMASYRWFSRDALTLKAGEQSMTVPLQVSSWINVNGQSSDGTGFQAAIYDPQAVGLTFGGGCFKGHGVNIDKGSARFILLSFQ